MALVEINWQPTRTDLRVFGFGLAVFCAIIGVIVFRQDGQFGGGESLLAVIAIVSCGVSFFAPERLFPVYCVFVLVTFPLGWMLSHLIFAVVFYAVFTPIGLVMRWLGRDPMQRKWDPGTKSYWTPHKAKKSAEDYFRQF